MGYRIESIRADVEDEAIAAVLGTNALGYRDILRCKEERRQIGAVLGGDRGSVGDVPPRDNQDMDRSRGIDISECYGPLIRMHHVSGDIAGNDAAKQAIGQRAQPVGSVVPRFTGRLPEESFGL